MAFTTPKPRAFILPSLLEWRKSSRMEWHQLKIRQSQLRSALSVVDKRFSWEQISGDPGRSADSDIERRKNLDGELTVLSLQLEVFRQTKASIDTTINAIVDSHARSSCLKLIRSVHETLPREIRDIVWSYLLDETTLLTLTDQLQFHTESDCAHELCKVDRFHFMNPSFMGMAAASEVSEVVARAHAEHHSEPYRPQDLRAFLNKDALSLGVLPVSAFFWHLRFTLDLGWSYRLWYSNRSDCHFGNGFDGARDGFLFHLKRLMLDIPVHRKRTLYFELLGADFEEIQQKKAKKQVNKAYVDLVRYEVVEVLKVLRERGFKEVNWTWLDTENDWWTYTRELNKWNVCNCAKTSNKKD